MELTFAAVMLLVAAAIWFVFLRPVPISKGTGVITDKVYQPAGTYWQYHAGDRRGFKNPTPIAMAESYSLGLRFTDSTRTARVSVNMAEAEAYPIGTPVRFEYVIRGIPLFWTRIYVLSISPVAATDGD